MTMSELYIQMFWKFKRKNRHKIMDLKKQMQAHDVYIFLIKSKPFRTLSFKPFRLYL